MKLRTMFTAFAFVALALSLGSCKKDWSCVCSGDAANYGTISQSYPLTNETKKDAESSCSTINQNNYLGQANCSIKK